MNPSQPPYAGPPQENDGLQNIHNPLGVMQPGERVLCELRRHPIGMVGIYTVSALIVIVALGVAALVPTFLPDASSQTKLGIILGAMLAVVITLLYAYIGALIYNSNRWIVTTDSITQISQSGLFSKQISQLSLANLEDVTVEQKGIMQTMFGFGSLRAESAGMRGKFVFPFCPNPNEYARKVIEAHETYIAQHPEETMTANKPLATVQSFNQPPPAQA